MESSFCIIVCLKFLSDLTFLDLATGGIGHIHHINSKWRIFWYLTWWPGQDLKSLVRVWKTNKTLNLAAARRQRRKTSQAPPSHSPCSRFPESASCCTRCFRSHSHSFRRKPWSILTSLVYEVSKIKQSTVDALLLIWLHLRFSLCHPICLMCNLCWSIVASRINENCTTPDKDTMK